MKNLIEYMDAYMSGDTYVLVETGMPETHSKVGVGDSWAEAYASLESTPHQCTGRDCGRAAALQYARDMGWFESRFLDEVPDASLTEEELD